MSARILVVDDEPDIRFLLKDILEDEGYQVDVAEHARAADEARLRNHPDLVLLDIWMPDVDGVTLLKRWKSSGRDDCPVVMMSGHGTVETAVEATRFGAVDFVEKPLSMAKLLNTVKSALSSRDLDGRIDRRHQNEEPVGNSQLIQNLKQRMLELQQDSEPVFLSGAEGSGRSIWASFLSKPVGGMQTLDPQQNLSRWIPLSANLYIEEVTDLDREQQSRLCDALVGRDASSPYRFIVSSQQDYAALKADRNLLPELAEFWSQAVQIPSLSEHIEDIPELLEYYVNWYSDQEQLPYRHFDVAAQNLLRNHDWRGGIVQLKQFIKTTLLNSDAERIEIEEIENTLRELSTGPRPRNVLQISIDMDMDLREAREAFEREYLSRHLALSGYNMATLARRVGQERTHLYRKLKSLGLQTKKNS
jgi:two-component system, NtrC family, nitrogen regulation response regulator NtrX